eukprot:scaffold66729_cov63-Phaeocystis_antarctica.AAC.4
MADRCLGSASPGFEPCVAYVIPVVPWIATAHLSTTTSTSHRRPPSAVAGVNSLVKNDIFSSCETVEAAMKVPHAVKLALKTKEDASHMHFGAAHHGTTLEKCEALGGPLVELCRHAPDEHHLCVGDNLKLRAHEQLPRRIVETGKARASKNVGRRRSKGGTKAVCRLRPFDDHGAVRSRDSSDPLSSKLQEVGAGGLSDHTRQVGTWCETRKHAVDAHGGAGCLGDQQSHVGVGRLPLLPRAQLSGRKLGLGLERGNEARWRRRRWRYCLKRPNWRRWSVGWVGRRAPDERQAKKQTDACG